MSLECSAVPNSDNIFYASLMPPFVGSSSSYWCQYRGADKSLDRPKRKQATATEDFDVHISYL
jgi:hypothetical protein